MKKRDIIILIIALLAIGLSVFFMLRMLFPPQDNSAITQESESIPVVPSTIDDATYNNIEGLADYGQANLEGIGKKDLFSGF